MTTTQTCPTLTSSDAIAISLKDAVEVKKADGEGYILPGRPGTVVPFLSALQRALEDAAPWRRPSVALVGDDIPEAMMAWGCPVPRPRTWKLEIRYLSWGTGKERIRELIFASGFISEVIDDLLRSYFGRGLFLALGITPDLPVWREGGETRTDADCLRSFRAWADPPQGKWA